MQKLNKKTKKIAMVSAAALMAVSVNGFGNIVNAADGADNSAKPVDQSDLVGKKADADSSTKAKIGDKSIKVGDTTYQKDGQVKVDNSDSKVSLTALSNLIKSAKSDTEQARVKAVNKFDQDEFNDALTKAEQITSSNSQKEIDAAFDDLNTAMTDVDDDLKEDLVDTMLVASGKGVTIGVNALKTDNNDSDAVKADKKAILDNYNDALDTAMGVVKDKMASKLAIDSANTNLKLADNFVLAASGDGDALKDAQTLLMQNNAELKTMKFNSDTAASQSLAKAISSNKSSSILLNLSNTLADLNKKVQDEGLKDLVDQTSSYVLSKDFKDLDKDDQMAVLSAYNEASAVENNKLSTPEQKLAAKKALTDKLSLINAGLNPDKALKNDLALAKEMMKNNDFSQSKDQGQAVKTAIEDAEAVQKGNDDKAKTQADKQLRKAMNKDLTSEISALKAEVKAKNKTQIKSKSKKTSDADSDGDVNDSDDVAQGDSGAKSDSDKAKDKAKEGDSDSDDDSDSNSQDGEANDHDQAEESKAQQSTASLPQTGRFVLQHAKAIAASLIAVIGALIGYLYKDRKNKAKDAK